MKITTAVDRTQLDPNRLTARLVTVVERARAAVEDRRNRPLTGKHETDT